MRNDNSFECQGKSACSQVSCLSDHETQGTILDDHTVHMYDCICISIVGSSILCSKAHLHSFQQFQKKSPIILFLFPLST